MAQNTSSTEKSHFTTFFQAYIVYQTEVWRLFERDDDKTKNENAESKGILHDKQMVINYVCIRYAKPTSNGGNDENMHMLYQDCKGKLISKYCQGPWTIENPNAIN